MLDECNLKAVVLKASADSIGVRETDPQRPPAGHLGKEHAADPCCAGLDAGGTCLRQRDQPNLSQRG